MKHLLSCIAALAATATLSLVLPSTARADSSAYTTVGSPTCTGTNSNGSAATWTISGKIYYTAAPGQHYYGNQGQFLDYLNIYPSYINHYDGAGTSPCQYAVTTSNDILPGCATITGSVDIYSTPYTGSNPPQHVSSYTISTPSASRTYSSLGVFLDFTEMDDVIDVQYKVKSNQNGSLIGEVATPYLHL